MGQTLQKDGKIKRFKYVGKTGTNPYEGIHNFLSRKENHGEWIRVDAVSKSLGLDPKTLKKEKYFNENLKRNGINVQKSARGDILVSVDHVRVNLLAKELIKNL